MISWSNISNYVYVQTGNRYAIKHTVDENIIGAPKIQNLFGTLTIFSIFAILMVVDLNLFIQFLASVFNISS